MKHFPKSYVPKRLSIKEIWTVFKYNTSTPVNMTGIVRLLYPGLKGKRTLSENIELYLAGLHTSGYTSFAQLVERLSASK